MLVRWVLVLLGGVTFEDAFISLRYAENLASGQGLVYNAGERVFGASTPLYVLLLAGFTRLGLPALELSRVLAGLADGATVFLWARLLSRTTQSVLPPLVFALLFGLSPFTALAGVSGMETSFALLLLTGALVADYADREIVCGGALGVLVLVRPEGVLAALVILLFRWRRTGIVPWRTGAIALALPLPWVVYAAWYYGTPVPHSIPAKVAAYNIHRPSVWPNLLDTLVHFAPLRGPAARLAVTALVFSCMLPGVRLAWTNARLRPLAALWITWWAYLVVPKTLLFPWYYAPLLLPAYVMAAIGSTHWLERGRLRWAFTAHPAWRPAAVSVLAVALVAWLVPAAAAARRVQAAEMSVRREIGLWLRTHTPGDAVVALEPIGYIGYYSKRRILDEVGLVSPEMVALNRAGAGWFPEMLARHRPDYIVERPSYLLRNRTLNSKVPMFRTADDRDRFLADYEAVAEFATALAPWHLKHDYRFVVFARRSSASAKEWRAVWRNLPPADREELTIRAISGRVKRLPKRSAVSALPRMR